MKLTVRKLHIEDVAKLQMLVAEHIDAIEPGLVVLDARLLLGHATIDVVGLDASGTLVLIATGLIANEDMLLKAVEAYSWCLEYPQSLERLYPSCVLSEERPPRLLFVVERVPDAFHRKIKQLGFAEVDCVEFRLLDVEGAPAVFFESILKLRRPAAAPAPEPVLHLEAPAPEDRGHGTENVIAMNGAVAARATSLKLQKLLNQAVTDGPLGTPRVSERPATPREPASIVSMVTRHAAATMTVPRADRSRPEPVIAPAPAPIILTPEPVIVAPAPVVVAPEPVIMPRSEPVILAPAPAIVHEAVTPVPLQLVEPLAEIAAAAPIGEVEPVAATAEPVGAATVCEPEPPSTTPNAEIMAQLERAMAAFAAKSAPVEPISVARASVSAPAPGDGTSLVIPSMNGATTHGTSASHGERLSLRTLPELSLQPSPLGTVPRPAPFTAEEARVSFKDLAATLLGTSAADAPAPAAVVAEAAAIPEAPVELEAVSTPTIEAIVAPVVGEPAVSEAAAAVDLEIAAAAFGDLTATAVAGTPAAEPIELAAPAVEDAVTELEPALTVEALIKSVAEPPVTPAAVPSVSMPAAPRPVAESRPALTGLPQEFAGLQFPNDGVLTRQWMEFLGQMSSTK